MTKASGERIAVLETQYTDLNKRHDKTDNTLAAVNDRLAAIENILREAKGGWRMLLAIGTVAAAIGAFSSKAVSWLVSLPLPK